MNEQTRTALVGRGMDENASTEEALEFAIQHMAPMEEETEDVEHMDDEEVTEDVEKCDDEDETKDAVERALKDDHARRVEIRALCKSAGI